MSEGARRPRLLIVDDGPDMVRLLEAIAVSTWDVHTAANLGDAVEIATAHPADAIASGTVLPEKHEIVGKVHVA